MTNFERLKSVKNEYEMTDIIMYVISTNFSGMIKSNGIINGIPLLQWLQKEHEENK